MQKFSKISITMVVDRNTVIKLHKSGETNVKIPKWLKMNRSTVWKIVKKFKETGNTLDRKGRGRKRSIRTLQLIKNMRKKLQRNPCQSCRSLAAAGVMGKSTMHQVLRDDLG